MPCYQCGSPEGSESVLCPSCRAERAKDSRPFGEKVLSDYDLTWKFIFRLFFGDARRVVVASVLITIPLVYYLIVYSMGPKFFSPSRSIGQLCTMHSTAVASVRASGVDLSSDIANRFGDTGEVAQALVARFGEARTREMLTLLMDGQTTLCRDFERLCSEESNTEFCQRLSRGLE
jgi:hypothetical protein